MPTYRYLIADKLFGAKEKALYRYVRNHVDVASFNLILCSSYYYFPLQTAMRLAKTFHLPLIVDLRDITEQWGKLDYYTRAFTGIKAIDNIAKKLYTNLNTHARNQVLSYATAVTTVSPWHQKILSLYNTNTQLIYNGFDTNMFYPKTEPTSTFNIAFIGKYYAHYALCPTPLFAALQQLIEDRQVDDHDVRVLFYTNKAGQEAFALLAKQYNIEQIVSTNEYILRSELVKKMHQSSILMILTTPSKDNGTHGIMGTKFYEILGVEKPCLCLNSDEECLAESIKQTNAGLAATNTEDVKAFVLEKYQEWKQNGYTHQQVINKEQFTRQHEAEQFEKLFIEIMKH